MKWTSPGSVSSRFFGKIAILAVAVASSLPLAASNQTGANGAVTPGAVGTTSEQVLAAKVRSAILKLPYYSVFDNLTFQVSGTNVALSGDVTQPWLKTQAEDAVRSVKGVDGVASNVNVLPLSPFDDRIRVAVARTLYNDTSLSKYAHVNPSIRIIVENGNVRLEGVVLNDMDRNIASIKANTVSGVFHVQNNLKLEKDVT